MHPATSLEAAEVIVDDLSPAEVTNATLYAWLTVLVAGLGYFVDVVDLWLFPSLRVASLKELGLEAAAITNTGAYLINCQQAGLLIGGVLFGVLGDKRGRTSVMFGSIVLYSVGNILNAFVTTVPQYAFLRFITGIGLAGEVGAGITLVCEILPRHQRGIGTTIVTGVGVAGAMGAALLAKYLSWRVAFFVGGVMGLSVLLLRFLTYDSLMCKRMHERSDIKRGSLKLLLFKRDNLVRFISCIAIGAPIYLTFSLFATFAPEIAAALGVTEPLQVPDVMFYSAVGMTVGDIFAGTLSQLLRRRKLPLLILISLLGIALVIASSGAITSRENFLYTVGLVGVLSGYWACLITTAAEQFGTNLRATVTTMVPNLVRATAIIITTAFIYLKDHFSMQVTLWILCAGVFACAFGGLLVLKETFHRNLDFYEK